MSNTRSTSRHTALAVVWVVSIMVSTVMPVTPQTVTNDGGFQMAEAAQMMTLACPAQYYPVCSGQPLEASLSTSQPLLQADTGPPRVDALVSVELGVPKALMHALLREQQTTGNPIILQVPEALPMILVSEDWEQIP
jgi:hypothetical protein